MSKIKSLTEKADLYYEGTDRLAEAGMPIGNGRMGSLIWFGTDEMHMQWNRSDVFANDASSQSFQEECSDYNAGTGILDLNLGTGEDTVFNQNTRQHLSVYDGSYHLEGNGIEIDIFTDMDRDICYLHIKDGRKCPKKIRLSLRTLRGGSMYVTGTLDQPHPSVYQEENGEKIPTYVQYNQHLATSVLEREGSVIRLRQLFEEKEYVCQSLLEVQSFGRAAAAFIRNQNEAVLEWPAGKEDLYLTIETAAAFSKEPVRMTEDLPSDAAAFAKRQEEARKWWHEFWQRMPRIDLHSENGDADQVSVSNVWFYYLMACTSRGEYMPRFGGLLFYSAGDFRYWGAQFWWHNQACYYSALVQQGCFELADAFYNQILRAYSQYEKAASQQWGTQGIFIPETCWFSGPDDVPEELIPEMQALFTLQKPWEERSEVFKEYAAGRNHYDSRWSGSLPYSRGEKGYGPYAYVSHIFSSTAKIAFQFYKRYRQTKDKEWLLEKGYPVIKGAAKMYCHLPFLQKKEDGKYHLCHVNNHENIWDGTDTISELSGLHGILPVAVAAARELGVDEDLQKEWTRMDEEIVPIRTNKDPGALTPQAEGEKEKWCCGTTPAQMVRADYYHNMDPVNIYELVTLETPKDSRMRMLAQNTYEQVLSEHGYGTDHARVSELEPFIISVSKMGDKDALEYYLPRLVRGEVPKEFAARRSPVFTEVLDNRMTLREGVQALSAERTGQVSEAIAAALCSCVPAGPGQEPVLHLFPACPDSWDASFSGLPAANGYLVSAEKKDGKILSVSLLCGNSQNGVTEKLCVHNPFPGAKICIEYETHKEYTEEEKFTVGGSCKLYPAVSKD